MGESAIKLPVSPASRRFVVLVSIAVSITTAVVVIAAVVGFEVWKDRQPDANGLANNVRDSMNQSLSSDQEYQTVGLHAKALTVLHVVENMFEGQATVATDNGADHTVPVHITYDGDTMLWRTDSGAFAFTVQERLHG